MSEREERGVGARLALIAGGACSFCGRPDARPIHRLPGITVCEECLRSACKELLEDLRRY